MLFSETPIELTVCDDGVLYPSPMTLWSLDSIHFFYCEIFVDNSAGHGKYLAWFNPILIADSAKDCVLKVNKLACEIIFCALESNIY